jgi:fructose-specific phosphotransferase system IIB component
MKKKSLYKDTFLSLIELKKNKKCVKYGYIYIRQFLSQNDCGVNMMNSIDLHDSRNPRMGQEGSSSVDSSKRRGGKMAGKKFIVGVTACQIGIAHTFMAAESLATALERRGCEAKIETQGATGAENVITDEDLARADAAIIAADVKIKDKERFEPIPTLSCKTNEVMTLETALSVVDEVLEAID